MKRDRIIWWALLIGNAFSVAITYPEQSVCLVNATCVGFLLGVRLTEDDAELAKGAQ